MSGAVTAEGPDFSRGIAITEIPINGTIAGRVGDQPVLLSRLDGALTAVSGTCTHYGAALAHGLIEGRSVRCPLHHACFDLRSGRVLHAPALDDLQQWAVRTEGEIAFVSSKVDTIAVSKSKPRSSVARIVIIGGGAAGLACANRLRRLAYEGSITMLSADTDAPYDRPNLSKDFLAGNAPEEWMPLRSTDWYAEQEIDLRLGVDVTRIDAAERKVRCANGDDFGYERLLVATGSEPNRLNGHGFHHEDVLTLRSVADARAVIERAGRARHAVVVGSSFIGLEAASALRARGIEVSIVSTEAVPFQRTFGNELGTFLQKLHERNGVNFCLGTAAACYDGKHITTANGARLAADYVLVGVGVRPRLDLGRSAGLRVADGIVVDQYLETGVPGIYAAGDIAAYPDPLTGEPIRIEHWAVAQRQGEVVAANMLSHSQPFHAVPFFWTEQHGVTVRYVGRASRWDEVRVEGDVRSGEAVLRYFDNGVHRATATLGRDLDSLQDERAFEQAITARWLAASHKEHCEVAR